MSYNKGTVSGAAASDKPKQDMPTLREWLAILAHRARTHPRKKVQVERLRLDALRCAARNKDFFAPERGR